MKSILYYTDNKLDKDIFERVQKRLLDIGLPIVSVSLKPINFGKNIVLDLPPGITTMTRQILTGLETIETKYVFFCEHDILYSKTHFDFVPSRDDTFYFNTNIWRWDYPKDRYITYDHLISLSGMCVNKDLALEHYYKRIALIEENNWKDTSKEPEWIRKLGHEPGKSRSLFPEKREEWKSEKPNIDIRHDGTISRKKCRLEDFKHLPVNWKETKCQPEI